MSVETNFQELDTMMYYTEGTRGKHPPVEELTNFLLSNNIEFRMHGLYEYPIVNHEYTMFIKLFFPLLTYDTIY